MRQLVKHAASPAVCGMRVNVMDCSMPVHQRVSPARPAAALPDHHTLQNPNNLHLNMYSMWALQTSGSSSLPALPDLQAPAPPAAAVDSDAAARPVSPEPASSGMRGARAKRPAADSGPDPVPACWGQSHSAPVPVPAASHAAPRLVTERAAETGAAAVQHSAPALPKPPAERRSMLSLPGDDVVRLQSMLGLEKDRSVRSLANSPQRLPASSKTCFC